MKKGQSSIEFIILVGAVLFFFVAFVFYLQGNIADKQKEGTNILLKNIAYDIQDEISQASKVSDGYSREFILPNDVAGFQYDATIVGDSVFVATTNGKFALSLPIENVTGNLVNGTNRISKVNGAVFLNP